MQTRGHRDAPLKVPAITQHDLEYTLSNFHRPVAVIGMHANRDTNARSKGAAIGRLKGEHGVRV